MMRQSLASMTLPRLRMQVRTDSPDESKPRGFFFDRTWSGRNEKSWRTIVATVILLFEKESSRERGEIWISNDASFPSRHAWGKENFRKSAETTLSR